MPPRPIAGIALALVLSAAVATASDYSNFSIPSHSWSRAEATLFGAYSPTLATTDTRQERRRQGYGTFSGSWMHGHDSDRLEHFFELSAGALLADQSLESDRIDPTFSYREQDTFEERSANETWRLTGEMRHYPLSIPLGFMGRVVGQGGYFQAWTSEQRFDQDLITNTAQVRERGTENWLYSHDVSAAAGLPWGRVRDVTGVQRVQYAEDRLVRDRVLNGPLEPRTRQHLAELFYTKSKFSFVHDLPDRHFWAEFERILRDDPAVRADRLDAYALYHAADPLVVSRGFGRRAGYSAGPVITFVHENDVRRMDFDARDRYYQDDTLVAQYEAHNGSRNEQDSQHARAGAEAQIEQPLGLRWHLSAFGAASSDLRGLDHDLQIRSVFAVRFWEGEHWYWDTGISQERHTGSEVTSLEWLVSYWSTLSYYLEDHVSFDLGLRGAQTRIRRGDYLRSSEVRFGLSFRTGSLTAPGLFAPVRPAS